MLVKPALYQLQVCRVGIVSRDSEMLVKPALYQLQVCRVGIVSRDSEMLVKLALYQGTAFSRAEQARGGVGL